MDAKLNKLFMDINKDTKEKEGKNDRHKGMRITVRVSQEDYNYFMTMQSILHNVKVNGRPAIGMDNMSIPSFCKMALNYFCNNIQENVFSNSSIVTRIEADDRQTLEELLVFRAKYMGYSVDKQISDLKKVGLLTKK